MFSGRCFGSALDCACFFVPAFRRTHPSCEIDKNDASSSLPIVSLGTLVALQTGNLISGHSCARGGFIGDSALRSMFSLVRATIGGRGQRSPIGRELSELTALAMSADGCQAKFAK